MDKIRVAAASLNQTPLDWRGNIDRIVAKLKEASKQNVELVCFPELSISGYGCEDMFLSLTTARQAENALSSLLCHTKGLIAVFGLPVYFQGSMYNCVAFCQNGKLIGINPKKILSREGVHYEPRWFNTWPRGRKDSISLCDTMIPFGDMRYQFGRLGVGVEICEEAWGAEAGASLHSEAGVELIVNASASHFALGKYSTRETLISDASRSMQVHYLYSNLVGLEAGRMIYDGGCFIASSGQIVARGRRFGFNDGELLIQDLDIDRIRVSKLRNRSVGGVDGANTSHLIVRGESLQYKSGLLSPISHAVHASSCHIEANREFILAEMLGLFDYLRKSKSKGFVVSLSGGCDSSSIAVLVAHTIAQALKELGPKDLAKRLGIKLETDASDPRAWIAQLLTLVYQATRNSGEITLQAATELAKELGAEFHHVSVDPVVEQFKSMAKDALGRELDWKNDDIALQNIQARARAPFVWLLANVKNALLLSTSNRSEASVGYATMDGDTAGSLAPVAGISKQFLRSWLIWAEKNCDYGLGPLQSLQYVNTQDPTAELRPSDAQQKDESDLMPYDVLNHIEVRLIRDRMDPVALIDELESMFTDYNKRQLQGFVDRFISLWTRNQWKRERFAPSFHLDDFSVDPKSWFRYPILS
jgi:NAD+ synthase (glutamine-hydrolysing)